MDKRRITVKIGDPFLNETISCGNFEHAKLRITIKGVDLDAEDQYWRFLEADDGYSLEPIGPPIFPIINGTTSFVIENFKRDLVMFRNPIGAPTTGYFVIDIETEF